MAKLRLTLLLHVALVLALATSSNASGPHRRDHADLGRLMKKRAPVDVQGDQSSAQAASSSPPASSSQASSSVAQATSANSVSASEFTSASASASLPTASIGLVVSGLLPTGSNAASSSVPSASSPSGHSSSASQTPAQASNAPAENPTQSTPQSILYLTSSNAPAPTQSNSTPDSSSGMSHAAMTVLVVIAASVGAAVIVWTIIRKWKFRPSSDFEGRMQPIDWQLGGSNDGPVQRSLSLASSFHSGGHPDDQMGGHVGEHGASALDPIPDHDFTAGPAHLAPVGGYADLSRGPNPQPMMQESFGHPPSINRPVQYDQYGVPLHHGYGGY